MMKRISPTAREAMNQRWPWPGVWNAWYIYEKVVKITYAIVNLFLG